MFIVRIRFVVAGVLLGGLVTLGGWAPECWAKDLKITLPARSELTPVQRLNREGVDAVKKHDYNRAEGIFEKAYLYDPSDPFTLNNLGYVAELQGKLDSAETFYKLAEEQRCTANIDLSSAKALRGEPMQEAFYSLKDRAMRVNRMNVDAVDLLSQGRSIEADQLLRQALALEPQDVFTLNNLGVANEAMGNYAAALRYYENAAATRSTEPVIVTSERTWEGKPVSKAAAESARRLEARMPELVTPQARAALLNVRGVSAANQNDWPAAKRDFLQAYALDPSSSFSLNNRGYVAEKEGDLETAEYFYSKARAAGDAGARIALATDPAAEGQDVSVAAADSGQKVGGKLEQYTQERRRQTGPIELIPRGGQQQPGPTSPAQNPSPTSANPPSATVPQ